MKILKACRIWKFCPFTNKEPTLEYMKFLEFTHGLRILIDLEISFLKERFESETIEIESEYEREENKKKEKEKYFYQIFNLFNMRNY